MAAVMIRCPRTGRPVSTQIETEPSVFSQLPEIAAQAHCPHCGEQHIWTMREAWLDVSPPASPEQPEPAPAKAGR